MNFFKKNFFLRKHHPSKGSRCGYNTQMLFFAQKTSAKVIHSCLNGKKPEFENYFTRPEELNQLIKEI